MEYDFFISYCRRIYQVQARDLTRELQHEGAEVWFDNDKIPSGNLSDEQLKRVLRDAVTSSRVMVFFDLWDLVHPLAAMSVFEDDAMQHHIGPGGGCAIPTVRGGAHSVAWNMSRWQQYERLFAERIVDIHPADRLLIIGAIITTTREPVMAGMKVPYKSISHAAELILEHFPVED